MYLNFPYCNGSEHFTCFLLQILFGAYPSNYVILSDVQIMLNALSEDMKNLYFGHVKNKMYWPNTLDTEKFCYIICAVDNHRLPFLVGEQRDGR